MAFGKVVQGTTCVKVTVHVAKTSGTCAQRVVCDIVGKMWRDLYYKNDDHTTEQLWPLWGANLAGGYGKSSQRDRTRV